MTGADWNRAGYQTRQQRELLTSLVIYNTQCIFTLRVIYIETALCDRTALFQLEKGLTDSVSPFRHCTRQKDFLTSSVGLELVRNSDDFQSSRVCVAMQHRLT